jgi:hypothetical protein
MISIEGTYLPSQAMHRARNGARNGARNSSSESSSESESGFTVIEYKFAIYHRLKKTSQRRRF